MIVEKEETFELMNKKWTSIRTEAALSAEVKFLQYFIISKLIIRNQLND